MTTRGFEFFEGQTTRNQDDPRITIRKGGLLVLNSGALALLPAGTTHVQLGYDAEHRAVAIRPAKAKEKGSYTLRESRHGNQSRLVQGRIFFAHYGLPAESAQRFVAEDFGDGMVGFHLQATEPMTEAEPETSQPEATAPKPSPQRRKARAKAA